MSMRLTHLILLLYVKLTAKTKDQMFFMNLNKRLTVESDDG